MTAGTAKERDVKEFDWTRKGPLPDLPSRRAAVPDRTGFGRNLDAMSDAGSDRGGRRNMESDGKPRDFGNWERKGPLSPVGPPVREGGRPRSNEGPGFRRSSPSWGEGRSQEGSRPPRHDLHAPSAAELDTEWRARMRPDQAPAKDPSNPPSPVAAAASPATRPRLNLQKRTVPDAVLSPAPSSTDSKASPFGGARPIDTAARERQVEERRQLAIRQKKESDDKAKAEKAEKQRQAKDQAKSEKAVSDANGKDGAEAPQGGKSFEILRRAGEDESGMTADQEPEEATGAAGATAEKEAAPSNANGDWRNEPVESAEAVDDEGWSTVGAKQRSNRRGQSGRTSA